MSQPPDNAHPSAPETQTIGEWVTPIISPRRVDVNFHNTKGVWKLHSWPKQSEMKELSLFSMALPEQWVRDVLIPATNEEISRKDINLKEFYVYLGCHFFMAYFEGISDRILGWSPKLVSIWERSPFRLQKYMALQCFTSITSVMRFTNNPSPSFLDRFHDVRHMLNRFNEHYLEKYNPSWLSCLNESMKSFLDKFCPGFMSVPRKPNRLGNEYHIIAYGD